MESVYTDLALCGSKNECARTDTVFSPISQVCIRGVTLGLQCRPATCYFSISAWCSLAIYGQILSNNVARVIYKIKKKRKINLHVRCCICFSFYHFLYNSRYCCYSKSNRTLLKSANLKLKNSKLQADIEGQVHNINPLQQYLKLIFQDRYKFQIVS